MNWKKALASKFLLAIGYAIGMVFYQSLRTGEIDWYRVFLVSLFLFCLLLLVPKRWMGKGFRLGRSGAR